MESDGHAILVGFLSAFCRLSVGFHVLHLCFMNLHVAACPGSLCHSIALGSLLPCLQRIQALRIFEASLKHLWSHGIWIKAIPSPREICFHWNWGKRTNISNISNVLNIQKQKNIRQNDDKAMKTTASPTTDSLMPWVAADWVQCRSSGSVFALGTTASSKFEKCQCEGPGSMLDKSTKGRVEKTIALDGNALILGKMRHSTPLHAVSSLGSRRRNRTCSNMLVGFWWTGQVTTPSTGQTHALLNTFWWRFRQDLPQDGHKMIQNMFWTNFDSRSGYFSHTNSGPLMSLSRHFEALLQQRRSSILPSEKSTCSNDFRSKINQIRQVKIRTKPDSIITGSLRQTCQTRQVLLTQLLLPANWIVFQTTPSKMLTISTRNTSWLGDRK